MEPDFQRHMICPYTKKKNGDTPMTSHVRMTALLVPAPKSTNRDNVPHIFHVEVKDENKIKSAGKFFPMRARMRTK